jgi:hypothetical protein
MLTTKKARSMLGRMAGLRSAKRQREQKWPNLRKAWAAHRRKATLKRRVVPPAPAFIQKRQERNEIAEAELTLVLTNLEAKRRRETERQAGLALERARARLRD